MHICKLSFLCMLVLLSVPSFAEEAVVAPVSAESAPAASSTSSEKPAAIAIAVPAQETRKDITVRQLSSIEFGSFVSEQGGGSVTISPVGARFTSGNISVMNSGFSGGAEFEIIGQPEEVVTLFLPDRVTLDRNGGKAGAVITNLTSSPADTLTLDAQGRGRVKVGGTLQLPGNVVPGNYSGVFDIDVRYLH